MRRFGKSLAFVVFLAACVWAFASRSDRERPADHTEKSVEASEDGRQLDCGDHPSSRDTVANLFAVEKSRADDEYKKLELEYTNSDVQAKILSPNVKTTLDELTETLKRNNGLEKERVKLLLAKFWGSR